MLYNLETIASVYNVAEDFDAILVAYDFVVAKEYFCGRNFLELGCATGESTLQLLAYADTIDIVEGSAQNVVRTREKVGDSSPPSVNYFTQLWEDYDFPSAKYSDIIWFHGIEHLPRATELLKKIHASLQPNGRLHVVTPNAYSLHRQVGVAMGLLGDVHELNARDKTVGHWFVFDQIQVQSLLDAAGFHLVAQEGIMIKPLPNAKMKELAEQNPALIEAYFTLGRKYKEIAAEMYFCVEKV